MGNVAPKLKPEDVEEYAEIAAGKFSKKEIQALFEQFVQISSLEKGDLTNQDLINEREFHLAMGFKNQNFILKRMFEIFDENGDGGITFSEFLKGLSALSGKDFDEAYLRYEIAYHTAVIDAINSTLLPAIKNEDFKQLVLKVLPGFKHHLAATKEAADKLGVSY